MQSSVSINTREYLVSFILIVLVVTIANLHAVFALEILLADDNARYFAFVNNQQDLSNPRSFIGLALLLKWLVVTIFSTFSVETARLFFLLVYMIPLSLTFYVFNRQYLHLSNWESLTAAVLVNIIPNQFFIPAFLDGSYTVPGMLALLATFMTATAYLQAARHQVYWLIATAIGWIFVCDLTYELSMFLIPVLMYYVFSSTAESSRKLHLYFTFIVIGGFRMYSYLQTTMMNLTSNPIDLAIQDTIERVIKSLEWWLPLKVGSTPHTFIFVLAIVLVLLFAFLKTRKSPGNNGRITRAYIFYGVWLISCSLPFWFASKYFAVRYFYVGFMALSTISLIAIYQNLILPRKHKNPISWALLLLIFSLYGTQRFLLNKGMVDQWNLEYQTVKMLLKDEQINANTQVAMFNITNVTGGHYIWSSGYLQYVLGKPGVRGIIGNELHFYDPFNLEHCGYQYPMSCMDPRKELIAIRGNIRYKSQRMTYFLQWINEGESDSDWFLYRVNNHNKLAIIDSGLGLTAYKVSLQEHNLEPEQVLWGNYKVNASFN